MHKAENTAAARRIGPILAVDADGDPVLGETFEGAGELETDSDGAGWTTPLGTIVEIGSGYYYYQATAPEALLSWIAVKLAGACQETVFREDIEDGPGGIPVGEPYAIGPILAVDADGDPVLGETFEGAGELEVCINGAPWTAAIGTIDETSDGYYTYTPDPTEVSARGWVAVKLAGACQETVFREDVVELTDADAPVINTVSPTPGVAPGDEGGFPGSRRVAVAYPVELTVGDVAPGLSYVCITLRVFDNESVDYGVEQTVYRDGAFKKPFRNSIAVADGTDIEFTLKHEDGWSGRFLQFTIDAFDGAGNKTSEVLIYELPELDAFVEVEEPVDENDGTIDHVARALDRMPTQYRGEDDE